MDFKNKNSDDIRLDRVAIKLLDTVLTGKYQCYSIFFLKKPAKDLNQKIYILITVQTFP